MNHFKDFDIKPAIQAFAGEKIKIERVLNKQITVKNFKIVDSKYEGKGNGKCLHLQVETDGALRIIFTGSGSLMEMIERVPKERFPFIATIIKENERFEFT